ncbi:hypothetical protein GCM10022402_27740 [Salinactinospora qingdaonensis]|uniref:Transposase n=2 Tax=Salinactinospora qingdaonensis TaxID=702744 RepID=A0ABP7FV81_9ACTN
MVGVSPESVRRWKRCIEQGGTAVLQRRSAASGPLRLRAPPPEENRRPRGAARTSRTREAGRSPGRALRRRASRRRGVWRLVIGRGGQGELGPYGGAQAGAEGHISLEGKEEVALHRTRFTYACGAALSQEQSVQLLKSLLTSHA